MEITLPALKLLRRISSSGGAGLSSFGISRKVINELVEVGLIELRPRLSARGSDTLTITPEGLEELLSRGL